MDEDLVMRRPGRDLRREGSGVWVTEVLPRNIPVAGEDHVHVVFREGIAGLRRWYRLARACRWVGVQQMP